MFADAQLNNTIHHAEVSVHGQKEQTAYAERQANLLAQQLNDSRNTEQAALAHATSAAVHASDLQVATAEIEARIQQQYSDFYFREQQISQEYALMQQNEHALQAA